MTTTLPAGFVIDTVGSPNRVRVQWPNTPVTPNTSTLGNIDFEAGDSSWYKGAGWVISTGGLTDSGTWSAKYTGVGQATLLHNTFAPVTPGTSITASCRVSKGNNREDYAGGAVLLQWFDTNYQLLSFNVGNVINTGTSAFQTSSVTATAPANAAFVKIGGSGTRDVKGRATDAVTIDSFVWSHTFTLGGTGEGTTEFTSPATFSFRVRDANGCTAVATRTINRLSTTDITYRISETPGAVTAFNMPLPVGTQAGDTIIMQAICPFVSPPGGSGYWAPTSGTYYYDFKGFSTSNHSSVVLVATAGHVSSGVPLTVADNGGNAARAGKFIAYRIPAGFVKSPLEVLFGGGQIFNAPADVGFSWPETQKVVFCYFGNENGNSVASYPLPLGQVSITHAGNTLACCIGFYSGGSPFVAANWGRNPAGSFAQTQAGIIRGI